MRKLILNTYLCEIRICIAVICCVLPTSRRVIRETEIHIYQLFKKFNKYIYLIKRWTLFQHLYNLQIMIANWLRESRKTNMWSQGCRKKRKIRSQVKAYMEIEIKNSIRKREVNWRQMRVMAKYRMKYKKTCTQNRKWTQLQWPYV